jgi:hypothetical protein
LTLIPYGDVSYPIRYKHAFAAAQAKPISYVDGVMAMRENEETGHTVALDYP